ncbi:MAG: hypothetical protein EOO42_00355 [Flavobacteriales bacterium]|nr:MAG: hypothetical protein EOO42_00355 [Flavobacteriales bacterium]
MKKRLLTIVLTAMSTFGAFAQFTAGNLAVYRYGNGVAPLANGVRVPVFVDEYTPAGAFVKTIAIPQIASGANYGFEGLGLTAGGAFEAEGYPVLSRDGSVFSIIGRLNAGSNTEFVIATVDATGTITATTKVNSSDDIGSPRSAVVEGNAVYFNGFQNGVRYKLLGSDIASTRVSTAQNAPRVLTIATTALGAGPILANKLFVPDNGVNFPMRDLPVTSSGGFNSLIYSGGGANGSHQIIALKTSTGRTIIYAIEENAGAPIIRKYRSNAGGDTWIAYGSVSVPVGTKSLSATISTAGANIYYTTYGTVGGNNSKLYSLFDPFTGGNEQLNLSATAVELATAPANTTFRGVTMAPGTNVLPVKLTAFNANEKNGSIRLNWSTASETNSSHYNILRSSTANDFSKISQVSASGTTNNTSNYSFVDETPQPGTNYYKLQQVDFNGDNETFGPVSATIPVPKTDFSVVKNGNDIVLQIYAAKAQNGKIEVADINGKINHNQAIQLEKGYNKVMLPANKLPKGLNVVVLSTVEGKVAKKTIL